MSGMSKLEKARAISEARDALASRPAGPSTAAVAAAMRRYLSAERYREHYRDDGDQGAQDADGRT
jgi:hypothetical protein